MYLTPLISPSFLPSQEARKGRESRAKTPKRENDLRFTDK
jgi:hypothetical protein